ncbi:MAG: MBL fold metallo-hydrolase [Phycisphaerales bacterium]|nr:MAG: MBL fold metallo-hydrolase [Phycisphaerales bacterium]
MTRQTGLFVLPAVLLVAAFGCKDKRQEAQPVEEPAVEPCAVEPGGVEQAVVIEKKSGIPDNTIWHFEQSAFLMKIAGKVFIFDYAVGRRPADSNEGLARGIVNPEEIKDENVYVFASHSHGDHFNKIIYTWREKVARIKYILSYDISNRPADAIEMRPGPVLTVDDFKVRAYPSSDQGVAFSIYVGDKHIYFAGDNAFWNWQRDRIEEDYVIETLSFIDQKVPIDIAFQVCDPRLAGRGAGGVYIFAQTFEPKLLVPIHVCGEYDFVAGVEAKLRQRGFKGRFWAVRGRADTISLYSASR